MTTGRLIHDNSAAIEKHISAMKFGQHNMLIYQDMNSLREIYRSHINKGLKDRNNAVVMLHHYETKDSVIRALSEIEIEVDAQMADRSLTILDADEIIFKTNPESFLQYLKSLESLSITAGKNGIDVIIDMGSFRHLGKKEELLECENRLNMVSPESKSSILCCYHAGDVRAIEPSRIDVIHQSHFTNFIIEGNES
jgi:hypothetical protein